MNVKEYIASGIIELYVMQALSPAELKEVKRMAAQHPEVANEIRSVQESLNNYARSHERHPRPSLRAEIMEAVASTAGKKETKVIQLNAPAAASYKFLAAACIALILISSAIIYSLYHKWQDTENKYTALLNEKEVLAKNYSEVKNSYDKTYADLAIVRNENARIITLLSTDSSKHYMARVFWNHQTHEAYIDVMSLPSPGNDKQYQLWALFGGKPVDAGIFEMDTANGMQQVKTILNADAWAVTLEPKGGSVSPTLAQMYLLSKS